MDPDRKLDCLKELLESSFLPALKTDLDSIPVEREHFKEYHEVLTDRLTLIYDLVQEQKEQIFENGEVHSLAILLLCELTATNTKFHFDNAQLQKNANRLLQNYAGDHLTNEVEQLIFEHYQSKLKKDVWKRNLGTIHGFCRYLEFAYGTEHATKKKLTSNWLSFCLSVALTIRECYENTYKELGINIFLIIFKHADSNDIRNLNIHSVIYESTFKDVHFMDEISPTENIWNCLYMCLDYYPNIDSLNWSQVDDMLEILIRNIPVSRSNPTSLCMLKFVPKLCLYFTLNREEIERKYKQDLSKNTLDDCRESCVGNSSFSCFRWAKSIFELFIFESYKLMFDAKFCVELLQVIHQCYMVCILPIPLKVIEVHLINFLEKFTATLMEATSTHKYQKNVVQHVAYLIDTFHWQLQRSSSCAENERLTELLQAFDKLKQHSVFS